MKGGKLNDSKSYATNRSARTPRFHCMQCVPCRQPSKMGGEIAALTLESSAIQAEMSGLLKDVTDMETGQRGYLLTGDDAYLQPYTEAKGRIEMDFASLRTGLSNRTQREQSLASQLESLVNPSKLRWNVPLVCANRGIAAALSI